MEVWSRPCVGVTRMPSLAQAPPRLWAASLLVAVAAIAATTSFLLRGEAEPAPAPQAPALRATPDTLATVFGRARGGETILLATGDYGTFQGAVKARRVILRAAPGASVTMAIDFQAAVNVRVEGVTVTGATIGGDSRHITIAGSRFTGAAVINAERMLNAGITLDDNTHADIDVCDGCLEGRVDVTGQAGGPSGIVIKNSVFGAAATPTGFRSAATASMSCATSSRASRLPTACIPTRFSCSVRATR